MNPRLRDFLEEQYSRYHTRDFIQSDPIQIPHRFTKKEDIEIASYLTCTIAWGQRISIIKSADRLMSLMDNSPHQFLTESSEKEWHKITDFVHRTFQPTDLFYFMDALRRIYLDEGGLERVFTSGFLKGGVFNSIVYFRELFTQWSPLPRTQKHISDPRKGSAAKRINLFLMWMCRKDTLGIHFGIWDSIPMSELIIPLDTHVGRVARTLGLLERKSNDWKSAVSLTDELREIDPLDPVRFDFSLFCTGLEYKK